MIQFTQDCPTSYQNMAKFIQFQQIPLSTHLLSGFSIMMTSDILPKKQTSSLKFLTLFTCYALVVKAIPDQFQLFHLADLKKKQMAKPLFFLAHWGKKKRPQKLSKMTNCSFVFFSRKMCCWTERELPLLLPTSPLFLSGPVARNFSQLRGLGPVSEEVQF